MGGEQSARKQRDVWLGKKLASEYIHYRRYLAEHLQIHNTGKFERFVTDALPKFGRLTTIMFRGETMWSRLPDHGYKGFDKPTRVTVPPRAVSHSDKEAPRQPIHWQSFLRHATAAGTHGTVDALVLEGMAPELSLVPSEELALGSGLFRKLEHLTVQYARDKRPEAANSMSGARKGIPKSRNGVAANGTAAEMTAWRSMTAASPKLKSFHLSLGRAIHQQGRTVATTVTTKLVNLIPSRGAPSTMHQLHLNRSKAGFYLRRQFALLYCQNVKLACLRHLDLYSESDHFRRAEVTQSDLLNSLQGLLSGIVLCWRRLSLGGPWPLHRTYLGADASSLEVSKEIRIGRVFIDVKDDEEESHDAT